MENVRGKRLGRRKRGEVGVRRQQGSVALLVCGTAYHCQSRVMDWFHWCGVSSRETWPWMTVVSGFLTSSAWWWLFAVLQVCSFGEVSASFPSSFGVLPWFGNPRAQINLRGSSVAVAWCFWKLPQAEITLGLWSFGNTSINSLLESFKEICLLPYPLTCWLDRTGMNHGYQVCPAATPPEGGRHGPGGGSWPGHNSLMRPSVLLGWKLLLSELRILWWKRVGCQSQTIVGGTLYSRLSLTAPPPPSRNATVILEDVSRGRQRWWMGSRSVEETRQGMCCCFTHGEWCHFLHVTNRPLNGWMEWSWK